MPAPTDADAIAYLGESTEYDAEEISSAFEAEKAAQAAVCRVPDDDADWPADLIQALMRRITHNLAVRGNALGVQNIDTAFGVSALRVGGTDAEVRRLEAPHRRLVVG